MSTPTTGAPTSDYPAASADRRTTTLDAGNAGAGPGAPRSPTSSCRRSPDGPPARSVGCTTSAAVPHARSARSPSASPAAGPALDAGSRSRSARSRPRSTWTSSSSTASRSPQLAQSIRRNVIAAVEQMTGLEVVEVNINVNDLHLPDEGDDRTTPRLRASSDHDPAATGASGGAVAAAVLRCRAVARLHGGGYNAITSYLPGRRVVGVAVTPAAVTVGVVGRYPATVARDRGAGPRGGRRGPAGGGGDRCRRGHRPRRRQRRRRRPSRSDRSTPSPVGRLGRSA